MFHAHQWKEIARTWAPPQKDISVREAKDGETLQRLAFGVTTIVYACADEACGETKKIECLGQSITQ